MFRSLDALRSTETFTYDSKTYPKVNITSQWNKIGVRQFNTTLYNEYTIPEGAYSYEELFTAIVNVMRQFVTDNSISLTFTISKYIYKLKDSSNGVDTGNISNRIKYSARRPVELVAVENNGLQQILPFTVPLPYAPNKDWDRSVVGYVGGRFYDLNAGMIQEIFDYVWISDMFIYPSELYYINESNCRIGTASSYQGEWANTNDLGPDPYTPIVLQSHPEYILTGVFNTFGMIMNLYTGLLNGYINGSTYREFDCTIDTSNHTVNIYDYHQHWSLIKCNNCIDHISNYKIEYYDPINWCKNHVISFDYLPNKSIMVDKNTYNYDQLNNQIICNVTDTTGNVSHMLSIQDGNNIYYNSTNSLQCTETLIDSEYFSAHFASIKVTATFNPTDITKDFHAIIILYVDDRQFVLYENTLYATEGTTVNVKLPMTYFGKGKHTITIDTTATTYTYRIKEWS